MLVAFVEIRKEKLDQMLVNFLFVLKQLIFWEIEKGIKLHNFALFASFNFIFLFCNLSNPCLICSFNISVFALFDIFG